MTSPYLLLEEVAAFARVPVATVRHWILTKKLPAKKPGRRVLVKRDDLITFIEGTVEPTRTEIPMALFRKCACGSRFLPRTKKTKFCSRPCQRAAESHLREGGSKETADVAVALSAIRREIKERTETQ